MTIAVHTINQILRSTILLLQSAELVTENRQPLPATVTMCDQRGVIDAFTTVQGSERSAYCCVVSCINPHSAMRHDELPQMTKVLIYTFI